MTTSASFSVSQSKTHTRKSQPNTIHSASMSKPNVVTVTKTPSPPVRPVEQIVTLMGVAKHGDKYIAVEAQLPLSQTKALEFGNRRVGPMDWRTARNQCDIEQRRRYMLGFARAVK